MKSPGLWTSPNQFREFSALENPKNQEIATRKMAEWITHTRYLPNPDQVLRKMGKSTLSVYRELKSDARVWAGMQSRKVGVMSMDWEIQTGRGQQAHADFIREVFLDYDVPRMLGEILNAPFYGYQPLERLWESDGRHTYVRDLVGKPPDWFVYGLEGELRFRKAGGKPEGDPVEDLAFQVARHDAEYINPYGFPILSCCFWPIVFKRGGVKFWAVFCEKWGMPHAYAMIPPGSPKEKVDEYLEQMERLVQDGLAVIYDNSKVNLVEASGKSASGDLYKDLLSWANDEVTTALLGHQGATSSTPGKLGSEDMAVQTREDIIWADKNLAEGQMDKLIQDMVKVNFGEKVKAPKFKFWEREDVDKTQAERDGELEKNVRVRFTGKYIQNKYGLAPDDFTMAPANPDPVPPGPAPVPPADPVELAKNPPTPPTLEDAEALAQANAEALEKLLEGMSAEMAQGYAEAALGPVMEFLKGAKGYDEAKAGLAQLFPKMDTAEFEAAVQKYLFLSESLGRET